MRKIFLALAALAGFAWSPVSAQVSANLPVTCSPTTPGQCVRATPVVNPDGTTIGGGGGGSVPTGSAGSPNAAVVSVQGITGGTPAAVVGNVAAGTTDSGSPVKIGGLTNTTSPTAIATGQRGDFWLTAFGALEIAGNTTTGTDAVANNVLRSIGGQNTAALGLLLTAPTVFNGTTWDRARGDTTGSYVVTKGSATLATGQVSIGTTSTLLVAARTGRQSVTLTVTAANACSFGNTGVTTTTGFPVQPVAGASVTLSTSAAIYGACASATTVGFIENY